MRGIEPLTRRFGICCSTTELHRYVLYIIVIYYTSLYQRGTSEIRTHGPLTVVCFQDRYLKPLGHRSIYLIIFFIYSKDKFYYIHLYHFPCIIVSLYLFKNKYHKYNDYVYQIHNTILQCATDEIRFD